MSWPFLLLLLFPCLVHRAAAHATFHGRVVVPGLDPPDDKVWSALSRTVKDHLRETRVTLRGPDGRTHDARVPLGANLEAVGRFDFVHLAPGLHRLSVECPSLKYPSLLVRVEGDEIISVTRTEAVREAKPSRSASNRTSVSTTTSTATTTTSALGVVVLPDDSGVYTLRVEGYRPLYDASPSAGLGQLLNNPIVMIVGGGLLFFVIVSKCCDLEEIKRELAEETQRQRRQRATGDGGARKED